MPPINHPLRCTVMEVDDFKAQVIDETNQWRTAFTDIRRTPDYPRVGETWYIDRTYRKWTFASKISPPVRPMVGQILQVVSQLPIPDGYLPCDGQPVAVADYPELYSIIQNDWGVPGDSSLALIDEDSDSQDIAVDALSVFLTAAEGDSVVVLVSFIGNVTPRFVGSITGVSDAWELAWRKVVTKPRGGITVECWTGVAEGTSSIEVSIVDQDDAPALCVASAVAMSMRGDIDFVVDPRASDDSADATQAVTRLTTTSEHNLVATLVASQGTVGATFPAEVQSGQHQFGPVSTRGIVKTATLFVEGKVPIQVIGRISDTVPWVSATIVVSNTAGLRFNTPYILGSDIGLGNISRWLVSTGRQLT
jgi:hypothetical protein